MGRAANPTHQIGGKTTMSNEYTVCFSNVDGAGRLPTTYTLEEARDQADDHQAESDQDGNPWGYSYYVRHNATGRIVYRATNNTNR
jgi:hypothetical protein